MVCSGDDLVCDRYAHRADLSNVTRARAYPPGYHGAPPCTLGKWLAMRITCTWCRLRTCCYCDNDSDSQQSQVSLHKIDATASSLTVLSEVENTTCRVARAQHTSPFFIVNSSFTRVDFVIQAKEKIVKNSIRG